MVDLVYKKDGSVKVTCDFFREQLEAEGWKVAGKYAEKVFVDFAAEPEPMVEDDGINLDALRHKAKELKVGSWHLMSKETLIKAVAEAEKAVKND